MVVGRERSLFQLTTPANSAQGACGARIFLDAVERITRCRPDLVVEVLFSDGDPGSVHPYSTLTSLENVTILNAWDDLSERFRGEEYDYSADVGISI